MAEYVAYLGNPYSIKYPWKSLSDSVAALLKPVVAHSSKFDSVEVKVVSAAPSMPQHSLLCYVVKTRSQSLIAAADFGISVDQLGQDGMTLWRTGDTSVSEVYQHSWKPEMLAKLVYHEFMHNKLRETNKMHRRKGLAAAIVDAESEQRAANSRRMGKRLHRKQAQWLGGFSLLGAVE